MQTPAEIGRAAAIYADSIGAWWYFKQCDTPWDLLPWGKARQTNNRLLLEVLAFHAYVCLRTAQICFSTEEGIEHFCAGFFSYLERSIPRPRKSSVIGANLAGSGEAAVVPETLSSFIAVRGEQYAQAYSSGPTGLLQWPRILTRDVPGLVVEPETLLELSLHMSAESRAHTEAVSNLIRECLHRS